MPIEENVCALRARLDAAARAAGRDPSGILLCAATKMNDAAAVRRAIAAGVDCCGENRVQELTEKLAAGAYTGKPVHFIGHLQTNKVNRVVGNVALIHSVDRIPLLECIEKEAAKKQVIQEILLEVNIGQEASKSGFTPEEAHMAAASMEQYPHVFLRGLMAIPPAAGIYGKNRKFFAQMAELSVDIGRKKYHNVTMEHLSMGMSDDFEDAILEGSTIIRVGTAIFGPRAYSE